MSPEQKKKRKSNVDAAEFGIADSRFSDRESKFVNSVGVFNLQKKSLPEVVYET